MNTKNSAAPAAEDEATVPSPCVGICVIDRSLTDGASALCSGCFRTLEEIVRWSGADDAYQRAVWMRIEQRSEDLFE